MDGTLRVLWYRRGEAQLQACFTVRDERGLQGLRDAGQRSDLRDAHRRAALLRGQTCIININRLWTLPPQVGAHIVERGPTELVSSGTSQEFKAVLLNGRRQQAIQRLSAWKARRRLVPAYGYPEIRLSPLLSLEEAVFALGLCLAQEGILDDAMGRRLSRDGAPWGARCAHPSGVEGVETPLRVSTVSIGIEGLYQACGVRFVVPQHGAYVSG